METLIPIERGLYYGTVDDDDDDSDDDDYDNVGVETSPLPPLTEVPLSALSKHR